MGIVFGGQVTNARRKTKTTEVTNLNITQAVNNSKLFTRHLLPGAIQILRLLSAMVIAKL